MQARLRTALLFLISFMLPQCGFGDGGSTALLFLLDAINPPLYPVGGSVNGLLGQNLVLASGDKLVTINAPASDFSFPDRFHTDDLYNIAIKDYPRNPT